ncbi:hypothetical protein M0805_004192 [Coniferiporia weirii]|nr:hypothetical protein M0805_004192 [Coniferiporia weirii]
MLLSSLAIKLSAFLTGFAITQDEQTPLHLGGMDSDFKADAGLMLSDVLTIQNSVSIFYSYARDTSISKLLEDKNALITVFAPTNKAVIALARKPHQGPAPVQDGVIISEEEFDSRSRENIERWISAHIVPRHPIKLSPTSQFEALLEGVVISVGTPESELSGAADKPEWERIVLNGNISVVGKAEAANGVLYLLDGAIYG